MDDTNLTGVPGMGDAKRRSREIARLKQWDRTQITVLVCQDDDTLELYRATPTMTMMDIMQAATDCHGDQWTRIYVDLQPPRNLVIATH
jgi:hypothetical protein